MRRILPKTLLRPLTHPLRPLVAPRRAATTTAETSKIPLDISKPARIPLSAASARRTIPQEVAKRREKWPPHPKLSASVLSDEELYNPETERQMPIKMELEFDHYRAKGYFPGEETIARTHYIDAERQFRSRIRGQITEVWEKKEQKWIDASKRMFMIQHAQRRGIELPDEPFLEPLTEEEALEAKTAYVVPEDVPEEQTRLMRDETGQIDYNRSDILDFVDREVWLKRLANDTPKAFTRARPRVVGYRIYLPNVVIRLMRNHTPPGEAYDPYIATFRIPPAMNKLDLRGYLKTVYGLEVTFIRTDLYWGKIVRMPGTMRKEREKGGMRNYKRAVVGLEEPFHYPDDLEELRALGRATGRGDELYMKRLETLESTFYLKENRKRRALIIQKIFKRATRYRAKGVGNRGRLLRTLLERKQQREHALEGEAKKLRAGAENRRSAGEADATV